MGPLTPLEGDSRSKLTTIYCSSIAKHLSKEGEKTGERRASEAKLELDGAGA